jgi:nucleoid-associated protein YgaU
VSDDRRLESEQTEDELLDSGELDPALAMPSPRIFRGSLIALLLGSVFAVWLLVLPPVGADQDSPPASSGLSTPAPTETAEPTAEATATASATATSTAVATASATPDATETAEPTAEATPQQTNYTVVPGDTMLAIAEQFLPPGRELNDFAFAIAEANGIADITQIQVGQVLVIPDQ